MTDPSLRWFIPRSQWHFHQRLYERHGIVLAFGEVGAMMEEIRQGRTVLIERAADGIKGIYALRCQGRIIQVAANPGAGQFITAYPERRHAIHANRDKRKKRKTGVSRHWKGRPADQSDWRSYADADAD